MKRKRLLREELEKSFGDWESGTFQPALDRAVAEHEFPEIRYYQNTWTINLFDLDLIGYMR